ncbi:hypothetical protein [Burkholderia sola]|uniref:hypothetical protein n=1 Tax=Burkholderia sola TaxID=2843302 RepID=UPI001C0A8E7A|nr:hypothetical protein BCCR75389_01795 [Burkholderia cenocepacia]CAG2274520.1 hypothetical protein BCCR75386_01811 [Burkholderia cenocepacia]CAG2274657.1 hypothetical protein BCCR75388_01813 [Burkholderia cenocepacia]CAG2274904.1 hypothetical protein BCCR75384_01811 [Burkholderia cenocepacia]CAG2274928.1 hypothetical protein BCCR75387_01811 [Burkholderia cenocepacia]
MSESSSSGLLDAIWKEVLGDAAATFNWLKDFLLGEFVPDRPFSVIVAEMLANFVPGVIIVTSARDAVAIIVRLSTHPERRKEVSEWILLCACLIALALPLVMAAAGAVAAGVGAVVTGVMGDELAAALRAVMLMLIEKSGKLAEMIRFLNKFIKGNILEFLKGVKFANYEKSLLEILQQTTGKLIGIVQEVRGKLLEARVFHVKIADHFESVQNLVQKLSTWEQRFYAVQQEGIQQIPRAVAELQQRLDRLLAQEAPKDGHVVSAGVTATKPQAVAPPKQEIHDTPGATLRDPAAHGADGTNGSARTGSAPARKEKPNVPPPPTGQPNVKIEEVHTPGEQYAVVNGVKIKPLLYDKLYHGADRATLGVDTQLSAKEVAAKIYTEGLPGRGNNIDLVEHAGGAHDRAFRGTTVMMMTPDGQAGAILWADEGGFVIELKNVKGYDVNAVLEGRVRKPDGSFGGNAVHGEVEIAVPGRVKPEQVEAVYEVVMSRSGRLMARKLPR